MLLLDVSLAYFCKVAGLHGPSHPVMPHVDVYSDQLFSVDDRPFMIPEEQCT